MAVVRSPDFLRALNQRDCACNIDPPASSYAITPNAAVHHSKNCALMSQMGPSADFKRSLSCVRFTPSKLTSRVCHDMSASYRFCCRSPLQAFLVGDSVVVIGFARGGGDGGAAKSRPGAVFLFILSR